MLHVDVYIPAVSRNYEFSLNEHVRVELLIDEMAAIISQKEQKRWKRDVKQLILCSRSNRHMLPMGKTMYQCKVRPGSQLILL